MIMGASGLEEAVASAPAKVILFGEHFVVYGEPAVVVAIDKRAYASAELRKDKSIYVNSTGMGASGFFHGKRFRVERGGSDARVKLEPIRSAVEQVLALSGKKVGVSVEVRSSIPVAAGLGSSAAVAASTVAAVSRLLNLNLSKEEVFRLSYEAERLVHGTPSGIDPAISTYGGALLFHKEKGFTPLNVEADIPLVVGNTGVERSTGELVASVRRRRERYPSRMKWLIRAGGKTALGAVEALKKGDLSAVGELMNINHALLCAIGVSHESLEKLIHAARNAGAYGAKLTGGGGGGCMIALAHAARLNRVAEAVELAGGTAFVAKKTIEGVRIER